MELEYIKQLQNSLGEPMGEHMAGFGAWLNGRVVAVSDEGDMVMQFTVREDMLNPMGNMHGGAVAAVVDEILGFQIFLKSEKGAAYVSMTMNIDFLAAAKPGDVITATPKVMRIGRKTANVTCLLTNEAGKLIAQGTSNFMRVI